MKSRIKRIVLSVSLFKWMYNTCYLPTIISFYHKKKCKQLCKVGPEIIQLVHHLFQEAHIPYFVDYGTLLGFVREQNFIKHDCDIDFGIPAKTLDIRQMLMILLGNNFIFKRAFVHDNTLTELAFTYKGVPVDFFLNFEDEHQQWAHFYDIEVDAPRYNEIMPVKGTYRTYRPQIKQLETLHIGDIEMQIPSNYEDILVAHYGKMWRIPNAKWSPKDQEGNLKRKLDAQGYMIGIAKIESFL